MIKFKEKIAKEKRTELKLLLEKMTNSEVDAVKTLSIAILKEREKAFWANPPEDYWRTIEHSCRHAERYMFSMNNAESIKEESLNLSEQYCIKCSFEMLKVDDFPALLGISLKQIEFGKISRVYIVNEILGSLDNIRLRNIIQSIGKIEKSSWWIEAYGKNANEIIDHFHNRKFSS